MKLNLEISDKMYKKLQFYIQEEFASKDIKPENIVQIFIEKWLRYHFVPFDVEYEPDYDDTIFEKQPLLRVHPRQRRAVHYILNSEIPSEIDEIWLLGSSITKHCHQNSDIDLCCVVNNEEKVPAAIKSMIQWKKHRAFKFPCDFMVISKNSFENNGGFAKEARMKGIKIYDSNN